MSTSFGTRPIDEVIRQLEATGLTITDTVEINRDLIKQLLSHKIRLEHLYMPFITAIHFPQRERSLLSCLFTAMIVPYFEFAPIGMDSTTFHRIVNVIYQTEHRSSHHHLAPSSNDEDELPEWLSMSTCRLFFNCFSGYFHYSSEPDMNTGPGSQTTIAFGLKVKDLVWSRIITDPIWAISFPEAFIYNNRYQMPLRQEFCFFTLTEKRVNFTSHASSTQQLELLQPLFMYFKASHWLQLAFYKWQLFFAISPHKKQRYITSSKSILQLVDDFQDPILQEVLNLYSTDLVLSGVMIDYHRILQTTYSRSPQQFSVWCKGGSITDYTVNDDDTEVIQVQGLGDLDSEFMTRLARIIRNGSEASSGGSGGSANPGLVVDRESLNAALLSFQEKI